MEYRFSAFNSQFAPPFVPPLLVRYPENTSLADVRIDPCLHQKMGLKISHICCRFGKTRLSFIFRNQSIWIDDCSINHISRRKADFVTTKVSQWCFLSHAHKAIWGLAINRRGLVGFHQQPTMLLTPLPSGCNGLEADFHSAQSEVKSAAIGVDRILAW